MVYKLGDSISNNSKSYFRQCLFLTDFQKNVNVGDVIHTYRKEDRVDYIIREYVFKGFADCQYQWQDSDSCEHCKGHIKVMNDNGKIIQICPGWANGKQSCILKIVKNENYISFLEDSLFKI